MKPLRMVEPTITERPKPSKQELISIRHALLMKAAIDYVENGKDGARPQRLITASNLSGIGIGIIEEACKRK